MFQNPTSATYWSRASSRPTCVQPPLDSIPATPGATPPTTLWAADRHLLGLLREHEVLTTSHLVRLTGMPERTVQHRLGVLYRTGLVNRHRPQAALGTCPHHVWLTPFGANAIGAEPPRPWSEDLSGLRTVAAPSDLWLGLLDQSPAIGLAVTAWSRRPVGITYGARHTGEERRLWTDAELTARLGAGAEIEAVLFARVDRVPAPRLASAVARWADYLAAAPASVHRVVLVLTQKTGHRAAILDAVRGAGGTPTIRNADPLAMTTPVPRLAVGLVESRAHALASEAVWRIPADEDDHRSVEVLTGAARTGR